MIMAFLASMNALEGPKNRLSIAARSSFFRCSESAIWARSSSSFTSSALSGENGESAERGGVDLVEEDACGLLRGTVVVLRVWTAGFGRMISVFESSWDRSRSGTNYVRLSKYGGTSR